MTRAVFEERLFGVLKAISIVLLVAMSLFPLVYMVGLSFKPIQDLLRDPMRFWPTWEQVAGFDTYRAVLLPQARGGQGFLLFIRNSTIVAVSTVLITLGVGILAAYSAARLRFFGKRAVSLGIILVYLFPAVVISIPLFVMFSRIGLRSSLLGLIVVYLASTLPVTLYMLRGYFLSIPQELEEAGLVDGLSRFGVIWRITFPLAAPAVAATALYVFMIAWNEFLYALLFVLENRELWTLSLGLQQLDSQEVPKTMLMAGSVIITLPVIVLFFAAERFLTEGLTAGGVKG
ncbi:MAG TPA: carbohydrate ABC transporter permease [Actinobacteria bacterium]|nr:carbohydrate ABC transporter permease [Actinomycetota bacterium]